VKDLQTLQPTGQPFIRVQATEPSLDSHFCIDLEVAHWDESHI
jgi:hypothetical protein